MIAIIGIYSIGLAVVIEAMRIFWSVLQNRPKLNTIIKHLASFVFVLGIGFYCFGWGRASQNYLKRENEYLERQYRDCQADLEKVDESPE